MISIGGLSNKEFSEMVQWFDTRRWSSGLILGGGPVDLKQKAFVLKTVFIHDNCVCGGVSEDLGNGA